MRSADGLSIMHERLDASPAAAATGLAQPTMPPTSMPEEAEAVRARTESDDFENVGREPMR